MMRILSAIYFSPSIQVDIMNLDTLKLIIAKKGLYFVLKLFIDVLIGHIDNVIYCL
jgi:hypothetical protein